jgi:hypothetical protein
MMPFALRSPRLRAGSCGSSKMATSLWPARSAFHIPQLPYWPSLRLRTMPAMGHGQNAAPQLLCSRHGSGGPRLHTGMRNMSAQQVRASPPDGSSSALDVPSIVWDNVAMDFMEGFPHINDKSVILTVVDRFSKYEHFIPFRHPYMATTVAKAFFGTIVRLHGMPYSIISGWDPVFTGQFWRELFRLAGVKLHMSLAFHP